jgi:aspartyl-tRNA(Asn)/glutamyl-tRNA(Gln) amidotransferase subunit A
VRIGYVRAFSEFDIDPQITGRLDAAVSILTELGAHVDEVTLDLSGARETIEIMWAVGCATLVEGVAESQRTLLDQGLRTYAAAGKELSAVAYREALIERENFASRLNLLHRHHDLLVMAAMPIEPFSRGNDTPPGSGMKSWLDWTPLTYPFNLSHQPAASVPCGFTGHGLPAGLQIVGRRFADATVLRASYAYEQAAANGAKRALPELSA